MILKIRKRGALVQEIHYAHITQKMKNNSSIEPVLASEAPRQIHIYIPDTKYTGLDNLVFDLTKNQYK